MARCPARRSVVPFIVFVLVAAQLGARPGHAQRAAPAATPDPCARASAAVPARTAGNVRELRLGLVLYGGVSLAIYMHGQTKELQNLVAASRAHEAPRDPAAPCTELDGTPRVYCQALEEIARDGVRVRVIIDSIAGTSAGGISGVFLAKALAHDESQEGLRQLWMENADIWRLMGGRFRAKLRLAGMAASLVLPGVSTRPPLDGDLMFGWVYDALEDMEPGCPGSSLVPPGERLRLMVPTTDFRGRPRGFVIGDPATGREREHRVLVDLTFDRPAVGPAPGEPLGAEDIPLLSFAARSTSSFPGAFPPINLENVRENVCSARGLSGDRCPKNPPYLERMRTGVFADYALDGSVIDDSWFVDGGVLDNYPFGRVIDDLVARAPSREVDRRLIYLQPDPATAPTSPSADEIKYLKTIWGALSAIARTEPIGDDFANIEEFNTRVRLAGGIIDRVRDLHGEQLADLPGIAGKRPEEIDPDAARREIAKDLEATAGLPYQAYLELRTLAVVEQLARNATRTCRLEESIQRSVLTAAVRRWSEERGLIGADADRDAQAEIRDALDVGYLWRQLRFVGDTINDLYPKLEAYPTLDRAALDEAQSRLAARIDETRRLMRGGDVSPAMGREIGALCQAALGMSADDGLSAVPAFIAEHRGTLDRIYAASVEHVGGRQEAIRDELQGDYDEITADWPADVRLTLYQDYLGFALWDLVLYPYQRLADAGELQEIRVVRMSPNDTSALGAGSADEKLGGTKLGHFGAFFQRHRREQDYFWGRLDGAERVLALVYGLEPPAETAEEPVGTPPDALLKAAFATIAAEESTPAAGREPLREAAGCIEAVAALAAREASLPGADAKIPEACKAR